MEQLQQGSDSSEDERGGDVRIKEEEGDAHVGRVETAVSAGWGSGEHGVAGHGSQAKNNRKLYQEVCSIEIAYGLGLLMIIVILLLASFSCVNDSDVLE
jgi:hypothetical protein